MNLSAPFILRPVMTVLLTIASIVIGCVAFDKLPVSNLPDVNYPIITVTVTFPGASPETMANTVATPLEKQFMTISGIKTITSSNVLGSSNIVLEFDIDKDIDLAAVDVQAAIATAKPQLPPDLPQDPTFKKVNPSSTPIVYISVTSPTMTNGELYDYANTLIGQRISIIEGVSQVSVYGSPSAVRAQVDPGHIAYLGMTLQDVSDSIQLGNQYKPLGQFDGTASAKIIYDKGGLYNAESYDSLIVAYNNGAPVRLEDLGIVINSIQKDRSERRYIEKNLDQPTVVLAVQNEPGANAVKVASEIKKLLSSLENSLPGSLQLKVVFDRSDSIVESIHEVEMTLIIAFILVVFVIFLYFGSIRDTIIPSIAIPMSVLATFAAIYPLGFTLNNLSLLALTLAVGFVVDDAIVVLENIVRHVEMKKAPLHASLEGSKEIGFTIISMTISLIAAFIPLICMAGLIGKLFQEFSITLAIVTLLSGIVSLTLTPMLCSRFIPPHDQNRVGVIANWSLKFNAWMLKHYKKALDWVFGHQGFVLVIGLVSVITSILLFKVLPKDFIPDEDIGFIIAYTESQQGTSSEQMSEYQSQIVGLLKKESAIESMVSISSTPVYRQGIIFIRLAPKNQRNDATSIIQDLYQKLNTVPGVNVYLKNVPLIDLNIGSQIRGSYQFLIQGLDSGMLYSAADRLLTKMQAEPVFQGVSTDMEIKTPQLNLNIDRDQAYALGINVGNIEQTLSLSYSGNRISRIQTPIDQYDVILELDRDLQRNPLSLYSLYLRPNNGNQLVPLSAVADWSEGVGPASINHFDQFPAVTITFNIAPGITLGDALDRLRELALESFPDQVSGSVKGAAETFEEAIQSISILIIVTVCVIYVVLGILYESFIHPVTILSTLPPAIAGGLLALYITGKPLSIYAYLGIILLIGIVKKNGIMMVDFALDNIRIKNESAEKSIYDACIERFRPIMMTTISTLMGALPLALGIGVGADARRPLGYVIIGGLCVSQLITLFLTPIIYLHFEKMREKWAKRKSSPIHS